MQDITITTDSSSEAVLKLLFKLKVKDVMSSTVKTFSPHDSMRKIQQCMKKKHFSGVPIIEEKKLVGMISIADIVTVFDRGNMDDPCKAYMTTDLIVLQDDMPVSFAVSCFNKYKFGRFPVVDAEQRLVGIVTTTDLISALLTAMADEVKRLENKEIKIHSTHEIVTQTPVFEFVTEPFNFDSAGLASTEIKKYLRNMNIDKAIARRVGIASYELEINQVIHSKGGTMRYTINPSNSNAPPTLIIEAKDTGPGIPDIEKALTEGFSTGTERVRSFGFGAGLGLPNTKRASDTFEIYSNSNETKVIVTFALKNQE
ncbi:MAG TPA: CBS domain-containing protein [Treponemataceae bacterium]|nr:CBS domain-containing protein [Treponemataceae bacterium]